MIRSADIREWRDHDVVAPEARGIGVLEAVYVDRATDEAAMVPEGPLDQYGRPAAGRAGGRDLPAPRHAVPAGSKRRTSARTPLTVRTRHRTSSGEKVPSFRSSSWPSYRDSSGGGGRPRLSSGRVHRALPRPGGLLRAADVPACQAASRPPTAAVGMSAGREGTRHGGGGRAGPRVGHANGFLSGDHRLTETIGYRCDGSPDALAVFGGWLP